VAKPETLVMDCVRGFLCAIFSSQGHKLELVETYRRGRRTYRRVADDKFELEKYEQTEFRIFQCRSCGLERHEPAPVTPDPVTAKRP
jgi:hypothetical protein